MDENVTIKETSLLPGDSNCVPIAMAGYKEHSICRFTKD